MSENNVVPAEVEAKQFGWVPKEEYSGDPEQWKDAETFLRRGKEINGFLRKDLEKIQRAQQLKDAEIAELKSTMEEFKNFHNKTEERAYKRALEELKSAKVDAIEAGNGELVVKIDDEIAELRETVKKEKETVKPETSVPNAEAQRYQEEFFEWSRDNQWHIVDPELRALAEHFGNEINTRYPNKKGKDFLEEVTRLVKEAAPEKFENPRRNFAAVSGNSEERVPQNKNKKTYDNLPPEAKAACDKFVKNIKGYKVEDYLRDYDWS
jgi:hypothetical protein